MNTLMTKQEANNQAILIAKVSPQLCKRVKTMMNVVITLLIGVGFAKTAMQASDIYFTLASMIWLWHKPLEKMELIILAKTGKIFT